MVRDLGYLARNKARLCILKVIVSTAGSINISICTINVDAKFLLYKWTKILLYLWIDHKYQENLFLHILFQVYLSLSEE